MSDKKTPPLARLGFGILCLLAATCAPAAEADWNERLAQAAALRAESAQQQKAADETLAREKQACQPKFQVNACINEAEQRRLLVRKESRARIIEADRIERAVKSEQRDARMAEKTERSAARNAELPTRQAQNTEAAQQASGARSEKARKKETDAAARVQKKAAQQAAHQRKMAEHEARVAEKKARAEARAAKQARDAEKTKGTENAKNTPP